MISIVMAPGERGTPRHLALAEYIADKPGEYDFDFGDVEVDLVFAIGAEPEGLEAVLNPGARRKVRAVELKMPADFAQSLRNGHLDAQRRQCPSPLQVAVLGSLGDVLRSLPEVTGDGWRNPREMAQAKAMILHGISNLKASGVDVSFGISRFDYYIGASFDGRLREPDFRETDEANSLAENMAQVVREARAYLEGDIHLPQPKAESFQQYCLMGFPGIGPKKADDLIAGGWRLDLVEGEPVRGVGPKTVQKMREAMR